MESSAARVGGFRNILVGVDGTQQSIAALRWAVGQAAATGSQVTAMMGWRPNVAYGYPDVHSLRESEGRALTDAVAEVDAHEVHVETVFSNGTPAGLLVGASAEADLLVLGVRRHRGVVGLVLGSVSEHVLAHAHCPVVVVPEAWGGSPAEVVGAPEAVPALT